jgi:putative restriction endonuclease
MMAERNVGLQGLLFEIVDRPMTTAEINEFLLTTNATLDWNPSNTDMAKQRINWLRSFGLIERRDEQFTATDLGEQYITEIQSIRSVWQQAEAPDSSTTEYATRGTTRGLDPEFRAVVLARYNTICPVSGVDHEALLDIAHVLSWSDYPEHRADFGNVLPLSRTHHAAFDAGLFTIDGDYRLQVDPAFETTSTHLQRTLIDQAGSRIPPLAERKVDASYLETRNQSLVWF